MLKEKTKLTLIINDLLEEVKGDNDSKKRAQQELDRLKTNIALKDDELKSLKPEVKTSIQYYSCRHSTDIVIEIKTLFCSMNE